MIVFDRVSKSYPQSDGGRRVILDNVTLQIPANRRVGVLGRNGAGKSTLLRMVGGSEAPDAGRISTARRLSWPLGFGGGFNREMTGRENLRFTARIYDADLDYVSWFVENFSELGPYLDMPVKTYSSGMRARLAFGLSLSIDFDCYLVDEITSVGDKWFRDKAKNAFDQRTRNAGMLIVSHNPNTIRAYCDMGLILQGGELQLFEDLERALAIYEG